MGAHLGSGDVVVDMPATDETGRVEMAGGITHRVNLLQVLGG